MVFVYKSTTNNMWVLLAFILSAMAFTVRANGFFIYVIVLSSFIILNKKLNIKYLVLGTMIFLLIYFPLYLNRHSTFGNSFDYGLNSNYLAENPDLQSSPNIDAPSLLEYISNNSILTIFNRFIIKGLLSILFRYLL